MFRLWFKVQFKSFWRIELDQFLFSTLIKIVVPNIWEDWVESNLFKDPCSKCGSKFWKGSLKRVLVLNSDQKSDQDLELNCYRNFCSNDLSWFQFSIIVKIRSKINSRSWIGCWISSDLNYSQKFLKRFFKKWTESILIKSYCLFLFSVLWKGSFQRFLWKGSFQRFLWKDFSSQLFPKFVEMTWISSVQSPIQNSSKSHLDPKWKILYEVSLKLLKSREKSSFFKHLKSNFLILE